MFDKSLLWSLPPEGASFTFAKPAESFRFVDENGSRDVLVLHRDGRVEVGAHLTPDDAGRQVFDMLRGLWRRHMGEPSESARYAPTAEQGQLSPLLAACAARGMTEREVIEHLLRENQRLAAMAQGRDGRAMWEGVPMTDEEYLRACGGWTCDHGHTYRTLDKEVPDPWSHGRHGSGLTIAAAVEAQLAEDRARFAFMLSRTIFHAPFPDGRELTVDLAGATIATTRKKPR